MLFRGVYLHSCMQAESFWNIFLSYICNSRCHKSRSPWQLLWHFFHFLKSLCFESFFCIGFSRWEYLLSGYSCCRFLQSRLKGQKIQIDAVMPFSRFCNNGASALYRIDIALHHKGNISGHAMWHWISQTETVQKYRMWPLKISTWNIIALIQRDSIRIFRFQIYLSMEKSFQNQTQRLNLRERKKLIFKCYGWKPWMQTPSHFFNSFLYPYKTYFSHKL